MPRLASSKSCFTCRRRKIRCDEAVPICARCSKAGYVCDSSSRLIFKQSTTSKLAVVEDKPRTLLKQPHIADLFHIYLKDLAPWYDLNDEVCTFAKEVGARALDNTLLFSAVVALAACYSSRKSSSSHEVAEAYHDRCLKLLICLSPTDSAIQDGTALATTCLLRSYEILSEDKDPNRHLFGASTLLPSQAPDLQESTLLACGFWNYLREDITYSLIHGCPLKIKIQRLPEGVVTASNLSNAITLFVARAINLYFDKGTSRDFQTLEQNVDVYWRAHQPRSFVHLDNDPNDFPTIKMLLDTHVAATQYYTIVRCMTAVGDRPKLAAEICGLAMSSLSDAVIVNSYGPICFAGQWVESAAQRNLLVKWLHDSQSRTGWNVKPIAEELKKAWTKKHEVEQGRCDKS